MSGPWAGADHTIPQGLQTESNFASSCQSLGRGAVAWGLAAVIVVAVTTDDQKEFLRRHYSQISDDLAVEQKLADFQCLTHQRYPWCNVKEFAWRVVARSRSTNTPSLSVLANLVPSGENVAVSVSES